MILVEREALVSNLNAGAFTKAMRGSSRPTSTRAQSNAASICRLESQRNQKEMLWGLARGGTWSIMTVSKKNKIHSTIAMKHVIGASSGVSETNSNTSTINVQNISDGGNGKAKEGAREKANDLEHWSLVSAK